MFKNLELLLNNHVCLRPISGTRSIFPDKSRQIGKFWSSSLYTLKYSMFDSTACWASGYSVRLSCVFLNRREFESHSNQSFFSLFQLKLYDYKVFFIMIRNYGRKKHLSLMKWNEIKWKKKKKSMAQAGFELTNFCVKTVMS